jgi:ABC-type lipoprotein release transport system permease subunit
MIAAAVATLAGAALAASYLPARRAARIDSLTALRG